MGCASSTPEPAPKPVDTKPPAESKPPAENNGNTDPTAVKVADAGPDEDLTVPVKELDTAKVERVTSLFKLWDVDSVGKLEIKAFRAAAIQVGPHKSMVLSTLSNMDLDGDGFVDAAEWDTWFKASAGGLSNEEFDVVIEDMTEAAAAFSVAMVAARAVAEGARGGPEDEVEEDGKPLPEARDAAVRKLFQAWDYTGAGFIDRHLVTSTSVDVGPHRVDIFSQLVHMDRDNDFKITLDEMLAFFMIVSPALDDGSFDEVISEMSELAQSMKTVAECTTLANATPRMGGVDDEDAPPPPPELSAARKAKVEALYAVFAGSSDSTAISLAAVEKCTTKVGPHETKLLKELEGMDANQDGLLTRDEMLSYFTQVAHVLNDAEFEMTIDDMIASGTANQIASELSAS